MTATQLDGLLFDHERGRARNKVAEMDRRASDAPRDFRDLAWAIGGFRPALSKSRAAWCSVVLDVASGRLVGRALGAGDRSTIAVEAWRDAVARRLPPFVVLRVEVLGESFEKGALRDELRRRGDVVLPTKRRFDAEGAMRDALLAVAKLLGEVDADFADQSSTIGAMALLEPGRTLPSSGRWSRLLAPLCDYTNLPSLPFLQRVEMERKMEDNEIRARREEDFLEELRWRLERRVARRDGRLAPTG